MGLRALAVLALAGMTALAEAPTPGKAVEFKLQFLSVHGRRQDTLTYDFDGDGKVDLFNTSIDFDQNPPTRWGAIHLQRQGGYSALPDQIFPISDRACALIFGDFLPGGGTKVGFIAEDGVYVYPWENGRLVETPVKIIHARTFYRSPSPKQLPVWQWKMDFDGDGRDDLILPVSDGYRIYFQTAPGIFGRVAHLEADMAEGVPRSLSVSSYADQPETIAAELVSTNELPRIEPVDINGDGLIDFVMVKKDTLTYFLQKEKTPGVFPSDRKHRFSFRVPTLADEIKKDTVNFSMLKFVDINHDGIADLVVTRIEGTLGLWDSIKTSIYIHLGTGKGNFIADKRIMIDGVSIDPEFIDMTGEGKLDMVTSRLRTDLVKRAAEAFLLGDIAISYEVFQFDASKNMYLTDPVFEQRILVPRRDLEKTGAGAVPLVFIRGDLTGDGRPDMVVVDPKTKELLIHPGVVRQTAHGRRIGFDGTPHIRLPLDRHPSGLHILDVNGDGVCDILLYYPDQVGLALSQRR